MISAYEESSYSRGRWGRPLREPSGKPHPPKGTNQPAPSKINTVEENPIHRERINRRALGKQRKTPHRVVRVLQQVGAVLGGEAVRLAAAVGRGRGRRRRHGGGGESAQAERRAAARRGGRGGGEAVAEKSGEHWSWRRRGEGA